MAVLAASIDGRLTDSDGSPGWPIDDRALAYGDGLFETIAVSAGRPQLIDYHRQRLQSGSRQLSLPEPPEALWEDVDTLAAVPGCGMVKVIWSRGSGRGYRPLPGLPGRRLVMALPAPLQPPELARDGVRIRLCRLRLGAQPALAGAKHLNRLEYVLARAEWQDAGIAEGLLLDQQGALVEATQSNLFLVRDGELWTPRLDRCGVAGILRRLVMERLAPARGLKVHCARLTLSDLLASDELFLTNSQIGIWPVAAVGGWQRPPGPVSRGLQRDWRQLREAGD